MWKAFAISNALLSCFAQGFGPLALAPMFGYFIQDFDSNLTDVIQFTGVCILVLGFSNLFWFVTNYRCLAFDTYQVVVGFRSVLGMEDDLCSLHQD